MYPHLKIEEVDLSLPRNSNLLSDSADDINPCDMIQSMSINSIHQRKRPSLKTEEQTTDKPFADEARPLFQDQESASFPMAIENENDLIKTEGRPSVRTQIIDHISIRDESPELIHEESA